MTNINKYCQFLQERQFSEKHVVINSTNLGCGRLGALICLQYASVCIHTYIYTYIHMQMDSRSSHPRILRGRASEVFVDKSASGGFASECVYMYICMYIFIYILIYPYASVCIQYASVCIRMHPYASIRLFYASERQYSTHAFAEKVKQSQNRWILLFYNAIRSAKPIPIQPINPNLINKLKITSVQRGGNGNLPSYSPQEGRIARQFNWYIYSIDFQEKSKSQRIDEFDISIMRSGAQNRFKSNPI